ncbi:MAG: TolC family protein [Bacteroidota bacterium]|nr:TolC family protein [Bacteroidota bacterium]
MKIRFVILLTLLLMRPSFGQGLRFSEVVETALRNNYQINIARIERDRAANQNRPGNAGFLPTVDAVAFQQGAIRNTQQEFLDGRELTRDGAQSTDLNANIELEWTFFDGFRMFARRDELEALEILGNQSLRAQMEVTLLELASVYFGLVEEESLLQNYRQNLQTTRERYRILETGLDVGARSGLEVRQAYIDVLSDSIRVAEQEARIYNLRQDLAFLSGDSLMAAQAIYQDPELNPGLSMDSLRSALLRLNVQILQARSQVNIAEAQKKQARSEFLPSLDLYGNYGLLRSQNEAGFLSSNLSTGPTVGIRLRFNLFNGFNDRMTIRDRELLIQGSEIALKQARESSMTSLRQSYRTYTTAIEILKMETQALEEAKKVVDIGLEQLELGLINSLDFRQLQLVLISSQQRFHIAEYNAKIAEIQLRILSGELSFALL